MGSAGVYFRPGKIIQAAKNLGVGVRAFEATAEYVQNYVQGGRILIKHQAVALRLADMATKIEAVRALARPRLAGGRRQCAGGRDPGQHGQDVRLGRDHEGRPARGRTARRQRHHARLRHREGAARRRRSSCTWTRRWTSPSSRSSRTCSRRPRGNTPDRNNRAHDPEKWEPVFGLDHAQRNQRTTNRNPITTITSPATCAMLGTMPSAR